jgi:hypothetical protein
MPTTYAHDLFGKKVYQKLPGEIKEVIRQNGALYRIGLHGPDILFYYMVSRNPVSKFGIRMHKERARAFFEQGMQQVRETGSRELLAYLLGFGCHYLLDSACHSYVNETADAGIMSHTLMEKEFDRLLMMQTGKDPYSYRPSDCIRPKYHYAQVIHRAIPLVRTGNIYISLKMMKFLTNLMVCDDEGRRRAYLYRFLSLGGKKNADDLIEHFMRHHIPEGYEDAIAGLESLYEDAILEAPEYLEELYGLSKEDCPLSLRWDRTYNG